MKKFKLLLTILLCFSIIQPISAYALQNNLNYLCENNVLRISNVSAGGLKNAVEQAKGSYDISEIEKLTVNFSELTNLDIDYISTSMTGLKYLDLSQNPLSRNISVMKFSFEGRKELQTVKFPDSTSLIEEGAFKDCLGLENISAVNVVSIANDAFNGCKNLTNINFTKVKEIGIDSFRDCISLKKIKLPSIKYLDANAFSGCVSLKTVHLGNMLESAGAFCFENCSNLSAVLLTSIKTKFSGASFGDICVYHPKNAEYSLSGNQIFKYNFADLFNISKNEFDLSENSPELSAEFGGDRIIDPLYCINNLYSIGKFPVLEDAGVYTLRVMGANGEFINSTEKLIVTDNNSVLRKLIQKSSELHSEMYKKQSFDIYSEYLEKAKKLIENHEYTDFDIMDATIQLQKAYENLEPLSSSTIIGGPLDDLTVGDTVTLKAVNSNGNLLKLSEENWNFDKNMFSIALQADGTAVFTVINSGISTISTIGSDGKKSPKVPVIVETQLSPENQEMNLLNNKKEAISSVTKDKSNSIFILTAFILLVIIAALLLFLWFITIKKRV